MTDGCLSHDNTGSVLKYSSGRCSAVCESNRAHQYIVTSDWLNSSSKVNAFFLSNKKFSIRLSFINAVVPYSAPCIARFSGLYNKKGWACGSIYPGTRYLPSQSITSVD